MAAPVLPGLRVALVQDWLTGMRGGEKVLEAICELFPSADIYTLVYLPENISETIKRHAVKTSFIQSFPFARRKHQIWFPFFPSAIERFEMSGYDLVISSSHCVAKGVVTRPHTLHVCYCHTPMRYAWDFYNLYLESTRPRWLARMLLPLAINYMRTWDEASASRVDGYIANSHNVRRRIAKYYRRDASVIHPPADTDRFTMGQPELARAGGLGRSPSSGIGLAGDAASEGVERTDNTRGGTGQPGTGSYYLLVSAMVPYKRDDLAVKVLADRGKPFVVVGDGPERSRLEKLARGRGEFRGKVGHGELPELYRGAKALLYPGEEDFGITPVEANACGRPVVAFKAGGVLETQEEGKTAVFFDRQDEASLGAALERLEAIAWDPAAIREHALRFSRARFQQAIAAYVVEAWEEFETGRRERPGVMP